MKGIQCQFCTFLQHLSIEMNENATAYATGIKLKQQ